ncbi:zinc-dependent alcohol dehydrogenase [Pengzhenrongella sp.]|jgi:2-desacetyl-2-hydroxyethyl bacteriochlorophyllide A dehydrogenase|uniref:zinc-dependent alcohol dehydrogenase n=1 Tax=Pengzhenrongella sp. TaxID=2888820 RepID=UPI002F9400D2
MTGPVSTMKSVSTGTPGKVAVQEIERPKAGPEDVVVRIRACGICGTDTFFVAAGGMPVSAEERPTVALGHEPAGEVVEVGHAVTDIAVGDHVVINPMTAPSGLIGTGGPLGGMREYLLVEQAVLGRTLQKVAAQVPFDVAALNEPMAVARHGVNRSEAGPGDKAVVFGAGPIGLGAAIWLKLRGAHVVVVDIVPEKLEKALSVSADAVINSSIEDVHQRLTELHGVATNALGAPRAGTDIYLDAAGAPQVIDTTVACAKWGARLVIVAVHKKPVDISGILRSELTILGSMGYPTELFEVTPDLADHWERFAKIISHRVPFTEVQHAFDLALTPGAADKVVVTFPDQAAG